MYRVCKSFEFEAAHKLVAPYEGKCSRLHGHSFRVEIVVMSETLNTNGMVVDFSDFSPIQNYINQQLDHCVLNETVNQPTCENIARHIFDWLKINWRVESVKVWESENAWAEYKRE